MRFNPISRGITDSLRGLRTGDQQAFLFGAALVAYGLWKRGKPQQRLVERRTLADGQTLVIRTRRGDAPKLDVQIGSQETR